MIADHGGKREPGSIGNQSGPHVIVPLAPEVLQAAR